MEVRYDFAENTRTLSVNGQFIETQPASTTVLVPGFRSPYSGPHSIREIYTEPTNPRDVTRSYHQKALRFTAEFPDYDLESSGPIEIVNGFEWDNGAPVEDASWNVEVDGQGKYGTGTEIAATWEPDERVLTRAIGPEGTIRGQDIREELSYLVEARATAYRTRNGEAANQYSISNPGGIPGTVRDLEIVDARYSPEPPFEEPGSSVTLTATVATIGDIDPADIFWVVDLKDANGTTVKFDLASGSGANISAVWDGTIDGEPAEGATSYAFDIKAFLNCGEDPPPEFRRIPDEARGRVLAQGEGDQCPFDDERLAFDVATSAKIEFFQGKTQVVEIPPSFLFNVRQAWSQEIIVRDGQEPGTQFGEAKDDGKASLCRVRLTFFRPRPRDEVLTLKVIDNGRAFAEPPDGHLHDNTAPPGQLFLKSPSPLPTFKSADRAKIGESKGTVAESEEIEIPVKKGQKEANVYYLAPTPSGSRAFQVFEPDGEANGSAILGIKVPGLFPLLPTISAVAALKVLFDPGAPAERPVGAPNAIVLEGATSKHQNNHNCSPALINKLISLSLNWQKNVKDRELSFNDISLPHGGKFDILGNYAQREKHYEHRLGENCDINTTLTKDNEDDPKLIYACKLSKLAIYSELPEFHYHVRQIVGGPR